MVGVKTISLDLETYSDVDLSKCGLYRYVEGDFHILILAYAFDDEEVTVVDMAQGEQIPQEVLAAIDDPQVIKAAWNAQFERTHGPCGFPFPTAGIKECGKGTEDRRTERPGRREPDQIFFRSLQADKV